MAGARNQSHQLLMTTDPTNEAIIVYDGSTPLANEKHELYSQNIAMGMPKPDAYERAGYTRSSSNAHAMERDAMIRKRITFLLSQNKTLALAERLDNLDKGSSVLDGADPQDHGFTQMWVLEQLKSNMDMARKMGEFGASNAALKMIGEHIGMFGGTKKIPNGSREDGNIPLPSTAEAIGALVTHINQTAPGNPGGNDGALRDLARASTPVVDVVDEKSQS